METLKKVPLNTDQLAHQLIKDDLINCQLIYGLGQLNINADPYLLHLSETLFMVLGYDPDTVPEHLWDAYYDFTRDKAAVTPLYQQKTLDELATQALQKLKDRIANPQQHETAGSKHEAAPAAAK